MSPRFIEKAIIAAMRRTYAISQADIRKDIGCTKYEFDLAVRALRMAGKIKWDCFRLSPSMETNSAPPIAEMAGGADRAGGGAQPSAPSPSISLAADPLPAVAVPANEGAGIARREDRGNSGPSPADPTLPGPSTLSEQVKAEAAAKGQSRQSARKLSATVHDPLPAPRETIAERFRRLASEVDAEMEAIDAAADAEERRERDLVTLPTPSALLRRAKRDWPDQCAAVQAMAAELGITLGEAWRRVIAAGVANLRNGGEALS